MSLPGYNQQVEAFQKALPQMGIHYTGRTDGIADAAFTSAMLALEMKAELDTGIPAIGQIFQGGRITMPLNKVVDLYFKKTVKYPEVKDTIKEPLVKSDDSIRAWQTALSSSLPIVGSIYQGPIDGEMNQQLQSAAQQIERTIQSRLKTKSVIGKIFDGKRFLTDPADVIDALKQLSR